MKAPHSAPRQTFRFLTVALCISFSAGATADESGSNWEVLTDCRLEALAPSGNTLQVLAGGQHYRFRPYFVDPVATEAESAETLEDQARYFSLPTNSVKTTGRRTSAATRDFLGDGFEVVTKWADARTDDAGPVYFAFLRRRGEHLSLELVEAGLARIYGVPPTGAWPGGMDPEAFLFGLKQAERRAQQKAIGIWSVARDSPQLAGSDLEAVSDRTGAGTTATLDINTASAAEIATLPGIGPALAERIIEARPFDSVDAITSVPGISARTLAGFRERIRIAGPADDKGRR